MEFLIIIYFLFLVKIKIFKNNNNNNRLESKKKTKNYIWVFFAIIFKMKVKNHEIDYVSNIFDHIIFRFEVEFKLLVLILMKFNFLKENPQDFA